MKYWWTLSIYVCLGLSCIWPMSTPAVTQDETIEITVPNPSWTVQHCGTHELNNTLAIYLQAIKSSGMYAQVLQKRTVIITIPTKWLKNPRQYFILGQEWGWSQSHPVSVTPLAWSDVKLTSGNMHRFTCREPNN